MKLANWTLVYDLAQDSERINAIQQATKTTEDYGILPDPALFGTPEWWEAIGRGDLPTHSLEGEISSVYWGSMGDWPEFELRQSDGGTSNWTRQGDLTRYVERLAVKIAYVIVKRKESELFKSLPRDHPEVLKILIENSRLRSCDIVPGPGASGFREMTTLYRPVGDRELSLIEESGHRRFPPRLAGQPIFYPVLDEEYAVRIARDWNTKDARSGFVGYVTRFHIHPAFLDQYEVHQVGGREHREYWIPAENLEEFNANLVGRIDVIAEFTQSN